MRSHRLLRALYALSFAVALAIPAGQPATAYTLTGCRWNHINITYSDVSSWYAHAATVAAANSWTNGTRISMTEVSSSPDFYAAAGNFGTGPAGITSYGSGCPNGYLPSGSVWSRYNTFYTDGYPDAGKQAVMAHEMGHALGLDEQAGTICYPPIMHPNMDSYFQCGINSPQQDDVNGINSLY